jgi:hypothetical protein
VLNKLRVGRGRVNGKEGRVWVVTREEVGRWARSYGVLAGADREGHDRVEDERV